MIIRSSRSLALALGAAAVLALGGCSQNGSYRLSWEFYATSMGGPIQSAAVGCGQHGVDSIFAHGIDETGDVIQVSAICPPGVFTGTAPNGDWTFTFHMYDVRGNEILIPPSAPKQTQQPHAQTIASEGAAAVFPVIFVPRAACRDGIDNDGNGLVDTAGSECDAGSAAPPDGGLGTPDSGTTGTRDGGLLGTPDGATGAQDGGGAGPQDGGGAGAQDGASGGARGDAPAGAARSIALNLRDA